MATCRARRARLGLAFALSFCATSAAAQDLDLVNVSLVAATASAARVLDVDHRTGTNQESREADLIVEERPW